MPPPRPRPAAGSARRSRRSRRVAPLALGVDQHVGQRLARQQRLLARLERAEARAPAPPRPGRRRAGPGRSRGSSGCAGRRPARRAPWRTASAPARCCAGSRVSPSACRSGAQLGVRHPHPRRQPLVDPLRHLRRARLGEGQAQDRRRIGRRAAAAGTRAPPAPASCRSPPTRTARRARAGRSPRAARPAAAGAAQRRQPLTAIPFVAAHQLVVIGIGRVFGLELGGERLVAGQPLAPPPRRTCAAAMRGEVVGRRSCRACPPDRPASRRSRSRRRFLRERPIFERPRRARDPLEPAALGDQRRAARAAG